MVCAFCERLAWSDLGSLISTFQVHTVCCWQQHASTQACMAMHMHTTRRQQPCWHAAAPSRCLPAFCLPTSCLPAFRPLAFTKARVWFGVRPEVVALAELPGVRASRARLLYKAGLRTPEAVAAAGMERCAGRCRQPSPVHFAALRHSCTLHARLMNSHTRSSAWWCKHSQTRRACLLALPPLLALHVRVCRLAEVLLSALPHGGADDKQAKFVKRAARMIWMVRAGLPRSRAGLPGSLRACELRNGMLHVRTFALVHACCGILASLCCTQSTPVHCRTQPMPMRCCS